jgi:hypothetical protein
MSYTQMELSLLRRGKVSFYATLVFLLLTNPIAIRFQEMIFQGVPGAVQYVLRGAIFGLCLLGLLLFPSEL